MKMVSIVTATYNAAATIADCLASVRSQTIPVEHIIIDGASTDNTLEIVRTTGLDLPPHPAYGHLLPRGEETVKTFPSIPKGPKEEGYHRVADAGEKGMGNASLLFPHPSRFSDPEPIRYGSWFRAPTLGFPSSQPLVPIISEPDKGIYDAMNKGIKLATGDIVGILNADDFYASPDVLSQVVSAFADPTVDACYGDLVYVKDSTKKQLVMGDREKSSYGQGVIGSRECEEQNYSSPIANRPSPQFNIVRYWKSGGFHPDKFYWGWMPPHPTFFVRRRIYEQYGLFNLDLGSAADYELMLRFLLKHRVSVKYIPEVLVVMREGGVSNASLKNRLKANQMDRHAWDVNGLKPYPWTLLMKPIRKIPQWFVKP